MFTHDLRYALRALWQSRGFSFVAILCLGLGIGLNTTIFSIVDGVLLAPYPYPAPDRLLVVGLQHRTSDDDAGLSWLDLRDLRQSTSSFSAIAGSSGRNVTLSDGAGEAARYSAAAVSADLFPMLGVTPIIGHGFTAADDTAGAAPVALLSHEVWTRRYQSDPSVVGRRVLINERPYQVVGVMPVGFAFPNQQRLWIPLAPAAANEPRDNRSIFAFGRLKDGVTQAQATTDLNASLAQLARDFPATNDGWTARLRTLRETFVPSDVVLVVSIMMGSVTLVLLVACSNVASLLVARAAGRRREIAVRLALGAGRAQILRQLLTESVVLGVASLPVGLGIAAVGTRMIAGAMPPDNVPYYIRWSLDWRSLLYSIAVAVSTALVFGLFPALQAGRGAVHESLKEGTRGNTTRRSWLRSGLVVGQVALALVCLVGALLFVRTFHNLNTADLGFDTRPLMTLRFFMTGAPYDVPGARLRRVEDIVRRIEAQPDVRAAFASNYVPLSDGGGGGRVVIDGAAALPADRDGIVLNAVTPHFNRTLGFTLRRGRDFTDAEGWARSPVAVINETMAARCWPSGNAVGGRFRLADSPADWFTVIGVIKDFQLYGINPEDSGISAAAFVPYAYQQSSNTGVTIRTGGNPTNVTAAARTEIRNADSGLPVFEVQTMEENRRLNFWQYGLYGWVFGSVGVAGVLLASVGLYGVLAQSVVQRTQEIGVRIALGAGPSQIFRLIVGQGVLLCAVGVVVGLALAPAATWFGRVLFYRVSPFDPLSFVAVAAMMLAVAVLASYVPARRATRVDPIDALRGE